MFQEEMSAAAASAEKKRELLGASKGRYVTAAVLAGMFVSFGVMVMSVIGGALTPVSPPAAKLANGAAFAVALSLVVMAGSELFTGNNFVMAAGAFRKKVSWKDAALVWIFSYLGNLAGSILSALVFYATGLVSGGAEEFILAASSGKTAMGISELLARGALCNILVCAAVWCSIKMKSESGKLVMIFWCIFTFVTCGFEHSVANMSMLALALLSPGHAGLVTPAGVCCNLVFVTLGNMAGGVGMAAAYSFLASEKGVRE